MGLRHRSEVGDRGDEPSDDALPDTEGTCGCGGRTRRKLVSYDDLPEFLKDNEYIRDHYRAEWPIKDALLSAFSWHNETLNVWTHLGGFLLFLALTVATSMEGVGAGEASESAFSRSINASTGENISRKGLQDPMMSRLLQPETAFLQEGKVPRWPRLVFLVGAMCCLACSAISHLLACHSRRLNLLFWRLDYTGISIMIVTSFVPPIYYTFFCNPLACFAYIGIILLFGLLAILTLLAPAFSSPCFRTFRALLFLAMGFFGVIPAVHAIILHWDHPECHLAIALEILMALAYAFGAGFYVSRVPERWKPGVFDLTGHSHQIFHVFVILGALAHYAATDVLLNWRDGITCHTPALAH